MFPTIPTDDVIKAWKALSEWLKARAEGKAKKHQNDQVLMDRILSAVRNTTAYNRNLADPKLRDRNVEMALSEEWCGIASLMTYGAGEDWASKGLAMMCMDKGFYWADPEAWTPERVKAAGIELDRVYEEVRRVVAKEKYKPLNDA